MDAVEYLREINRMCKSSECPECPFYAGGCVSPIMQRERPQEAVDIVRQWAEAHPVEGGIVLTTMERRFVRLYIEKGFLWAARDMNGEMFLYTREPRRSALAFVNVSPSLNSCRRVAGNLFPMITWEAGAVSLPRLLENQ